MNLEQAKQTFVEESRELVREIENALLRIENGDSEEDLNGICQAVHTIREAAEFLHFSAVAASAYGMENLLIKLRNYETKLDCNWVASLFLCSDHLHNLINHVAHTHTANPDGGVGELIEYFTSGKLAVRLNGRRAGGEACAGYPQIV